jgi:hypothetical protein
VGTLADVSVVEFMMTRKTAFVRLLLAAPLVALPASAGLMDRETAPVGGQVYYAQNANNDWSLNVKGTPPCVYRFEVRSGDHWVAEAPSQRTVVERSELEGPTGAGDIAAFDREIWTAYDFMIEPGPPSTSRWVVLGDWHVQPDPGDTAGMTSPWQVVLLAGDSLAFDMRTSGEKPVVHTAPRRRLWESSAPIERGAWHALVSAADFDWRPKGTGSVKVWLDGKMIVDYAGPFGYNTVKPPYFKFGVYRASAPETLAVDYADVVTSLSALRERILAPAPRCLGFRDRKR